MGAGCTHYQLRANARRLLTTGPGTGCLAHTRRGDGSRRRGPECRRRENLGRPLGPLVPYATRLRSFFDLPSGGRTSEAASGATWPRKNLRPRDAWPRTGPHERRQPPRRVPGAAADSRHLPSPGARTTPRFWYRSVTDVAFVPAGEAIGHGEVLPESDRRGHGRPAAGSVRAQGIL